MKDTKRSSLTSISFVIPAYNAAGVIDDCLGSIAEAASKASLKNWEVIVVNDGSTDETAAKIKAWADRLPIKLVTLKKNQGRFAARMAGITRAAFASTLLVDTKVILDKNALVFLADQHAKHPERQVWNCHVLSDAEHNVVAAFNGASVMLVWGRYLLDPRTIGFGIEEFDYYPKGTTCILLPTDLLQAACRQFTATASANIKYSSDDTRLLRYVATKTKIWLSPEFKCHYQARSGLKQFIPWVFNRGVLFIDSYLHTGTRFYWLIIAVLLAPFVFIAALFWQPWLIVLPIIVWLIAMIYFAVRLPRLYAAALVKLSIPYLLAFIAGLYKGWWLRVTAKKPA